MRWPGLSKPSSLAPLQVRSLLLFRSGVMRDARGTEARRRAARACKDQGSARRGVGAPRALPLTLKSADDGVITSIDLDRPRIAGRAPLGTAYGDSVAAAAALPEEARRGWARLHSLCCCTKRAYASTRVAMRTRKKMTAAEAPSKLPVSMSSAVPTIALSDVSSEPGALTSSLKRRPCGVPSCAARSDGRGGMCVGSGRVADGCHGPGSKSAASRSDWMRGDARAEMRCTSAKKFSSSGMRRYGAVRYDSSSSASLPLSGRSSASCDDDSPSTPSSSIALAPPSPLLVRSAPPPSPPNKSPLSPPPTPKSRAGSAPEGGALSFGLPPIVACISLSETPKISLKSFSNWFSTWRPTCTSSTRPKPRTSSRLLFSRACCHVSVASAHAHGRSCVSHCGLGSGSACADGERKSLKRKSRSRRQTSSGHDETRSLASPDRYLGSSSLWRGWPTAQQSCSASSSSPPPNSVPPLSQPKTRRSSGAARATDPK